MSTRSLPLLLAPLIGMLLAWILRPPEVDWNTLKPKEPVPIRKRTLHFPDGSGLRFIEIPGTGRALSVTEVPDGILSLYGKEAARHSGAQDFCRWVSAVTGETVRLPTAGEWRTAARGGVRNAEFPWGFGPPAPPKDIHFARQAPPEKPGPALGYGFRDLAGGKWDWTQEGLLLGSAWTERDPQTLYIDHAFDPPAGYAGKDTGIRLLWEIRE